MYSAPSWDLYEEVRFPIARAKKGNNRCLMKVTQSWEWRFALRVLDEEGYLQSLRLDVSARRGKRGAKDVLSITARWLPESTVWTPPELPVRIEIWSDERPQGARLLATLQGRTEVPVDWGVPDDVQGTLGILAKHTGPSGKTHEAKFSCQAHNIPTPVTTKEGHWETYDVTDGLGSPWITSIVQDRKGYLWFGLHGGGACRYDGQVFRTFTAQDGLPNNHVWEIFEDSRGVLWFGTMSIFVGGGGGVCRYDGKTFQTFTTRDGLVDDRVSAIGEDDRGHLWFGTTQGVSEFDGATSRNYTEKDRFPSGRGGWVGAITKDKDGNLWFGRGIRGALDEGTGAVRYDGELFRRFTKENGLVSDDVNAITIDAQGNVWFGTYGGVSRYDGKGFQNFTTADGLPSNAIADVLQAKNGDLWFGGNGISRYRPPTLARPSPQILGGIEGGRGDSGKFQDFTAESGLAGQLVSSIAEDREGVLWFGSSGGVSRYDRDVVSLYHVGIRKGSAPKRDRRGNLWFVVSGGKLGRYDGKSIQTFSLEDGLPSNRIGDIYEDSQGNLWMGSGGDGLFKYDGVTFQRFTRKDGLSGNWVYATQEDRNGILWVVTWGGGVCTYDGEKFVQVASAAEAGSGWINDIIQGRNGQMWLALAGRGVSRYDGKSFTRFATGKELPPNIICYRLLEDRRGQIWIATDGGLCRYDGETFRTFTTADGLNGNSIGDVFEDSRGNLWFSVSTGGVHKFDGKNFQQFTTDDGLLSNNVLGILEDEKGNMIFATSEGFTLYTPPVEKIPPPVAVTEVVADKVYPLPVDFRSLKDFGSLRIPSTAKHITFAYHGMSFKTRRMRYNYMLEGYDKDWQATWETEASYDNLKPGDYVFKVIAINRDLVYSETPATVHLTMVPPWYLNGWIVFPSLGALSAMLFVAFYFGKRLQTQRAIAQQFNPYIAGRVVGSDLFYGRSDILTDIERTLANNCFLLYGERRIGKTSLQHQLKERLQRADDPTYKFIPAYIDLQGVVEDDFFRTIAAGVVEACRSRSPSPPVGEGRGEGEGTPLTPGPSPTRGEGELALRLNEAREGYTYRDLNRDLRTIIDYLKTDETKAIKIVLLMDEVDTLNAYSLRTNLNLRGLFMGPLKENLVLVMSGLYWFRFAFSHLRPKGF